MWAPHNQCVSFCLWYIHEVLLSFTRKCSHQSYECFFNISCLNFEFCLTTYRFKHIQFAFIHLEYFPLHRGWPFIIPLKDLSQEKEHVSGYWSDLNVQQPGARTLNWLLMTHLHFVNIHKWLFVILNLSFLWNQHIDMDVYNCF